MQWNTYKTALVVLVLIASVGFSGCGKEAKGNEEEHNVTLPVVAQGDSPAVQNQDEVKLEIPVVGDDEAYKTMLVNITHPIAKEYTMELVSVAGYKMDARAAEDMRQMLADAKAEGLDPIICSAYRSVDRQITLFNNQVNKQQGYGHDYDTAFERAKTVVAYPGTSEHHTGLAADIVARSHQVLDDSQENTAEQKWLMANSWKYGYILRYPSDKCDYTKIIYEPWHYRYVGKEVAQYLYENDLCLEEYWLKLAEMDPEKYGYILEETAPEQIVPKQEPQPAPQLAPVPVEQPSEQTPQDSVILDNSFSQQQQDAAAGMEGTEPLETPAEDESTGDGSVSPEIIEDANNEAAGNEGTNDESINNESLSNETANPENINAELPADSSAIEANPVDGTDNQMAEAAPNGME